MSDAIELRPGAPADAAAIRALTRQAYAKWTPVIGREPLPMTADYEDAVLRHRFDLLFAGSTLAALIETVAHADHLLIVNVAVAPPFQRRGFGRRLLTHAEQVAAASGLREIRLYTNPRFAGNVALYANLGYRMDREEEFRGGVVVHMSKAL